MKHTYILPALIVSMLFSALSCQQKEIVHEEDISLKNSIQFQASEYEAILSRSGNGNLATKKTFLGMAGKDSLFILATVSENNTYDQVQTKAGESTPVLGSFHIKAYKDGANSPYVDEKLTSEDGWNTYSPTLYWPNTYDHIDFFAYSYDVGENLALTNFRITDGHIADFDYVTPSSVQPDLSFAIAPGQTEEDAPIDLDFFHTLAAVRFVTGDIGEVSNPAANVKISNILSKGHCTITCPDPEQTQMSADDIEWSNIEDSRSYTTDLTSGDTFMIIPQELDENMTFDIEITIGEVVHSFEGKKFIDIIPEGNRRWEANKKYTYIINKGGEVNVDVSGIKESNTVMNKVTILNTGFNSAYIRAAIFGYWYVTKAEEGITFEEISSIVDINDDTIEIDWGESWETHWTEVDGLYYHKTPVAPGAYTDVPIFNSYTMLKENGPVEGAQFKLSIAVQAVEADKANETPASWPINQLISN